MADPNLARLWLDVCAVGLGSVLWFALYDWQRRRRLTQAERRAEDDFSDDGKNHW